MKITSKLQMDLEKPGSTPIVAVVQNDSFCRKLQIELFSGGTPFLIPTDTAALIRYCKSDGKGGEYDTLPDGSPGWHADENRLTIALAPQVLTFSGSVDLSVSLLRNGTQLSTFAIILDVRPVAHASTAKSENYFYVTDLLHAPPQAEVGQFLRIASVNQAGKITELTADSIFADSSQTVDSGQVRQIIADYLTDCPFLTEETDPGVPDWAKQAAKPDYTHAEVGAEPMGSAAAAVSAHNHAGNSHTDIREALDQLSSEKAGTVYVDKKVAMAIAGKTQLEANFANSIDDCIDPSKVYIMPDNMIWAYLKSNGESYTNQLPISTDADSRIYNGTGFKNGFRLTSSGFEAEYTAHPVAISGFIPCKQGDVIRLKNVTLQPGSESSSNQRISVYDAAYTQLGQAHTNVLKNPVVDENGVITSFVIQDNEYLFTTANTAYLRFCAAYIGEDSIVTVNEEITQDGDTFEWASTGHAFIPADYEGRILTLEDSLAHQEEQTKSLSRRVAALEDTPVPDYVQTGARAVARIINSRHNENSFTFAFLSDAHCGWYLDTGNNAAAQAGQALNLIHKRAPLDCVIHAGDFSAGSYDSTISSTLQDFEDYSELMHLPNSTVELWLSGNHDDAPYQATKDRLSQAQIFGQIGRKNLHHGAVCAPGCNYGYRDFDTQNIRIIFLDTDDHRAWQSVKTDNPNTPDYLAAHTLGAAQLRWLAEDALDLSQKSDPAQWGIIVVSHVPLNISGAAADAVSGDILPFSTANAAVILGAYQSGSSGTVTADGESISYNFRTQNSRATIYCLIHGHNHSYVDSTLEGILSIGCPNVMNGRENASSDGVTYTKTEGTALGTSFCILTVDRTNGKIYADHYGAGFSRCWNLLPPAALRRKTS